MLGFRPAGQISQRVGLVARMSGAICGGGISLALMRATRSRLGAIRRASPTMRIGACRINLISQAVPTVHPRVGSGPHCRAGIRPSPIWGGQTKREIAESMTELRYLAPYTLDEAVGAF